MSIRLYRTANRRSRKHHRLANVDYVSISGYGLTDSETGEHVSGVGITFNTDTDTFALIIPSDKIDSVVKRLLEVATVRRVGGER